MTESDPPGVGRRRGRHRLWFLVGILTAMIAAVVVRGLDRTIPAPAERGWTREQVLAFLDGRAYCPPVQGAPVALFTIDRGRIGSVEVFGSDPAFIPIRFVVATDRGTFDVEAIIRRERSDGMDVTAVGFTKVTPR